MSRKFEVAYKIDPSTKKIMTKQLENGDTVDVKWDVRPEDMPEYATLHAAGADFKAVEDVIVPSMWKAIGQCIKLQGKNVVGWLENLINTGGKSDISIEEELKKVQREALAPTVIHTGIKAYMENDEVLAICNRSSGPKKLGFILGNSVGVIDADYYGCAETDGEIMFAFYNIHPFDVEIKKGDRVGQGVFSKILRADGAIASGEIRTGGFGSSDKK